MQTWPILTVTGGDLFDGEDSDEWVETEGEWVRIHRRPRRDLFFPHDSQGGPESIDISKRRESIVCSTGEGEWRARVKSTGRPVAGETRRRLKICLKSGQEAQDSESLGVEVLYDYESENHQHRETCGSDNEQTQPLAEDDFLLDVNGGILDLRPTSQQGKRWNLSGRNDQRKNLWLIRKKRPKLLIGCGKCILFCTVLCHEQIRRRA